MDTDVSETPQNVHQLVQDLANVQWLHDHPADRETLLAQGETHTIVWNDEDYITCLRLADNRFLSWLEYRAFIPTIVKNMKKEAQTA